MNQNRRRVVQNQDLPWRDQLSPELAHAYGLLPSSMSSPIAILVEKALLLRIHPNLLVQYALLSVYAERQTKGDAVSKDHAIRSRAEIAGELHGIKTGYGESAEAVHRYRRGRQARQRIAASLEGILTGLKKAEQIVRRHRSELSLHLQPRFSDEALTGVRRLVMDCTTPLCWTRRMRCEKRVPSEGFRTLRKPLFGGVLSSRLIAANGAICTGLRLFGDYPLRTMNRYIER